MLSGQFFLEQAVPVTVPVEGAEATELEPGLGVALGVEFHKLHPVGGDEGHEGNIVRLGHGVGDGDEVLILHILDADCVAFVRLLRLQGRQSDAAAADDRTANAVDHIAAEGTHMEFGSQHVGGGVLVDDGLTVHQLDDGDVQCLGQWLQQGNVRQTLGSFPLGDGLAADADSLGQLRLGQILLFTKLLDCCTCYICVHGCHVLPDKRVSHHQ